MKNIFEKEKKTTLHIEIFFPSGQKHFESILLSQKDLDSKIRLAKRNRNTFEVSDQFGIKFSPEEAKKILPKI